MATCLGFFRSSHGRCSVKTVILKISQNSQENTCAKVSFLMKLQASTCKKETLAQVSSCELCEISKSTYFTEHLWVTAFVFDTSDCRFQKIKDF